MEKYLITLIVNPSKKLFPDLRNVQMNEDELRRAMILLFRHLPGEPFSSNRFYLMNSLIESIEVKSVIRDE